MKHAKIIACILLALLVPIAFAGATSTERSSETELAIKDTVLSVRLVDANGEDFKGEVDLIWKKSYSGGKIESRSFKRGFGPSLTGRLKGLYPEFPYTLIVRTVDGRKGGSVYIKQPKNYDPYKKETRISVKVTVR